MRLEGSLDAFSLSDIFSLLSMTKKTGGLHLRRDGVHGVVWVGEGALTGGASDLRRAGLARRIAGTVQLTDEDLAGVIEQAGSDDSFGVAKALHDAETVEQDELKAVVSEHITDTVFDLLRWPDGDFEFVVDEPNADDIGVARPVDEVVTAARERLESWESIAERVPSPDTVLSLTLVPDSDPELSRDEWALLALIDGQRTVRDLVTLCGRGEFAVVGALAELVSRGLVRADGDGATALVRRQQLLTKLEGGEEPPAPRRRRRQVPRDVAVRDADDEDTADEEDDQDDEADDGAAGEQRLASVRGSGTVSPQRPEPFKPPRRPDHPEPALAAVAGGGAVPAPAIERDPSVNKSLLLRLIAGVRGL